MRKLILLLMLSAALNLPLQAQPSDQSAKLQIAASQYEIIGLLMQKHDYSQILGEYRKILNLGLSLENEKPLVQATWVIVDNLRQAGQYSLAAQILNEALPAVTLSESKFFLMMAKGKVLKDQGKVQEAMDIFRKAQQFAPVPVPEK
jgi:tetratricopeptide (TPR) repeat protein